MDVKIVRSAQRARTVSAQVIDGVMVVRAPAGMDDATLQPLVDRLTRRLERRQLKNTLDDRDLERMAHDLNARYFDGKLPWNSVRWVTNQETSRWGSCTPSTGAIRLSYRLAAFPRWVVQGVLMHELTHLVEPAHSDTFWRIANRYPLTERTRGYLIAKSGSDDDNSVDDVD